MSALSELSAAELSERARQVIANRSLVFVGLMGAGKSVIGRLTANALQLPFVDSDAEIEHVSSMSVAELFEAYGEPEFRALEARVIKRLLADGPKVLSTGGGAFMQQATRGIILQDSLAIWLKADLEVLWERVSKRTHRPLLKTADPKGTLRALMDERYPIYEQAHITVHSRNVRKETIVDETIAAVAGYSG